MVNGSPLGGLGITEYQERSDRFQLTNSLFPDQPSPAQTAVAKSRENQTPLSLQHNAPISERKTNPTAL